MVLQNSFHEKNHTRVETCNSGKYKEFQTNEEASDYISGILSELLLNRLKTAEGSLIKQYQK